MQLLISQFLTVIMKGAAETLRELRALDIEIRELAREVQVEKNRERV